VTSRGAEGKKELIYAKKVVTSRPRKRLLEANRRERRTPGLGFSEDVSVARRGVVLLRSFSKDERGLGIPLRLKQSHLP